MMFLIALNLVLLALLAGHELLNELQILFSNDASQSVASKPSRDGRCHGGRRASWLPNR